MGFFRRQKEEGKYLSDREVQRLTDTFLRSGEGTGIDMGSQMAGMAFRAAVKKGHMPPPGWTFTNRFLFGDPAGWSDATADALRQAGDRDSVVQAGRALIDLLDHLTSAGGTIGEWMAAEESVTVTLTVLCAVCSRELCRLHPEAVAAKWGGDKPLDPDNEVAWHPGMTACEWLIADEVRQSARGVEATFAFGRSATGPGDVVRAVIAALGTARHEVQGRIDEGPRFVS